MDMKMLAKFWPLIYSIIREFWAITEPYIEDAAVKYGVPIELYLYSELGLENFSVETFQKRDPFSNPEQFQKMFARFDVKGWILPLPNENYQASRKAFEGVSKIIQAGDEQLLNFDLMTDSELIRALSLVKQIIAENLVSSEPPEKWAIIKRFRTANGQSPLIVQIRESFMDLFAYRDDSHLSVARPHFGQAGIIWGVLTSIWKGSVVTAEQMAETMSFRGYDIENYEVAIQAAVEIGWVETADTPSSYRVTQLGRDIREQVERLTDEHFYRPWTVLEQAELDELYELLTKLREQLSVYRKGARDGRL